MSTTHDKSKTLAAAKAKSGLRLVPAPTEQVVAAEELPKLPRKRSNLASFFDAYADAIDRDIKAILDL